MTHIVPPPWDFWLFFGLHLAATPVQIQNPVGAGITSEVPLLPPLSVAASWMPGCALQSSRIGMYSLQSAVKYFRIHFSEALHLRLELYYIVW